MKFLKYSLVTLSLLSLSTHLQAAQSAAAPAHQNMDAALAAIVKDNDSLRISRDDFEQKYLEIRKALNNLQRQKEPNCCQTSCASLKQKCSNVCHRTDIVCTQCFADPCQVAMCQTLDDDDCSDVARESGKLLIGFTCCLPCNIARGLLCGTTYVCCDPQCSRKCLNLK